MPILVCVIGVGGVGEAIAHTFVAKSLCHGIYLKDANVEKATGVAMDFAHASRLTECEVRAFSEWAEIPHDIDFVFVTAGVRQNPGESRRDLYERNEKIMKSIIPDVSKHSPYSTIVIVSNPCDAMTMIAQTLAGPNNLVFGSGTLLDSCRLQSLIATKFGMRTNQIHNAFVLGEHGDASVLFIRHATVSHIPLHDLLDKEEIQELHEQVIDSAEQIIKRKGYTNTAISFACAHIFEAMQHDASTIMPLSVNVKGLLPGVTDDVCLSVLCTVSKRGVHIFEESGMRKRELRQLVHTAEQLISLAR